MRKSSVVCRPRSTSFVSSITCSLTTSRSRSGRASITSASRKASQAFSEIPISSQESNYIDDGHFQGRIKVITSIKNPDLCTSVSYRNDGRFYAVGLANGTIHVYSSKTDNILYTLNNEDKDLSFADISTTCVRFRPDHVQNPTDEFSLFSNKDRKLSKTFSRSGSMSDVNHFLPPINATPRSSVPQVHNQRRRRSSHSALGLTLDLSTFASSPEKSAPNNLLSVSFTDGKIKTFNFLTEQCVSEMKENREILTMEYNRSGSVLATGGEDGCLHVYDVETGALKCSYEPPLDYNRKLLRTYSIAFHPVAEEEFISGGWNKTIQFYDARVANLLVSKVPGPKITGNGLSFHSSGKEFCAAAWGNDEGLYIFDYAMRRSMGNIFGAFTRKGSMMSDFSSRTKKDNFFPSSYLYSARYFLENYIAVGGAFPGSMTIVQVHPEKNVVASISNLQKSVFSLDVIRTKIAFIVGDEVCCSEIFL